MALNKEIIQKFKAIVEKINGPINILITQVDPDALASAFGMLHLLRILRNGANNARIYYAGSISHPQNRALCNRLGLFERMQPMSKLKEENSKGVFVLVDSSMSLDGRLPAGLKVDPIIVVDHHRDSDVVNSDDKFVLIDPVGAASTLIFELMKGCEIKLEDVDGVVPLLLAVGIHTDTNGLVSCSTRDLVAYQEVQGLVDRTELMALFNYPLQPSNFENLKLALQNVNQQGAHLVTNIGAIHAKEGDDLSTIADYLIRKDGVSLVIVWALITDEKRVRISARCTDSSLDLGSYLRDRFGPSCGGKFTPDGKSVGGGTMNLEFGFWMNHHTLPHCTALVGQYITSAMFGSKV